MSSHENHSPFLAVPMSWSSMARICSDADISEAGSAPPKRRRRWFMRGILPDRDQRQGNVAQRRQQELQVDRGRLSAWAVEGTRMFVYNSAETET